MDIGLDSGNILSKAEIKINNDTYVADILSETCKIAPLLFKKLSRKQERIPIIFLKQVQKGF
jgi:methionyl-tRNA formyltransferase